MICGLGQRRARGRRARGAPGRRDSSGERAASSTVVAVRSYSRKVPTSSLESETCVAGQQLGEQRAEQPLVRGVGVGVQQRHGDGLGRGARELLDERARAASGSSARSGPSGAHALGRGEAQLARHERRGRGVAQPVEVRPVLAAELDHVGEARGGDQRGARGAALEQRVGGDGHAVREALDVVCVARRRGRAPARTASSTADGLLGGRRGDLGGVDARRSADAGPRR